ncbi:MAG: MFS transporter [Gammaproteobacteria bacterium]|nr:MFS transporter [Gammaproteobacteria bacterium]
MPSSSPRRSLMPSPDPAMGYFSDKIHTRWGRRRPWIAIGVPIYAFVVWMLLNPNEGATIV